MGTRRTVVSFMRPVAGARTRCVTLFGINAQMLRARRMPTAKSLERIVRNIGPLPLPLPVEYRAGRHRAPLDLVYQRLLRRERPRVPQPPEPLHRDRRVVQIAAEIEQMNLEAASVHAERGPRP